VSDMPRHLLRRGERWRAPYATDPARSRGRVFSEPDDELRSPFQRDRDRVIHSNAFRRLKHKTQVFIHHESDHFRTRLTHSLEVAQIARSIARPLGLDEDLCEALALGHDLGHPPFGHAGERALDQALANYEGFDHNAQTLRVVTDLERRYPSFDGLNLTWETLEGLVKHNGPLLDDQGFPAGAYAGRELPYAIRAFEFLDALRPAVFASLEAQVAAISDDVAYDCHDIEDGLRAGVLGLNDLRDQMLTEPILTSISKEFPHLEPARQGHELVRRVISAMIQDVLFETAGRIEAAGVSSPEGVREARKQLVGFSAGFAVAERALKAFLFDRVYRHEEVMRPVRAAERTVLELFGSYFEEPQRMPVEWNRDLDKADAFPTARRAADYIAGMTDRYALAEHSRMFDHTPELG
jgi:dGTPase